jgi:steroid delta-isomerase-like uncharacterized protein
VPNDLGTEALVKGYIEAIASRDLDRVWSFYDDDIVYEDVAVAQIYRGIEETKRFYEKSMSALDVTWFVDTVYATDEGFGISWRMEGTHVSDLPGMPATGKSFSVPGASIARVRGGRIVHNRDFWNLLDLLKQLGLAR